MDIVDLISVIVYDYLWGMPLVLIVLLSGVYIMFRTGFMQFRLFGEGMRIAKNSIMGESDDSSGIISSFEALTMAIGTTIGVGNIGGVAAAIALGGPGALFWMWVAALLGLATKVVEIALAVYYRSTSEDGEAYGGPNYYIHKGIGIQKNMNGIAKVLSFLFAFGFLLGIFINIQTYTVSEAVAGTFGVSLELVGVVYTVVLYMLISGGMKRLGEIATVVVPFMSIFYIIGSLVVIFLNIENLIPSIKMIFSSAFTYTAAAGGFAGAGVKLALSSGMSRSVFSNEAGWGSAPMIHASSKVNHPMKQGLLGIFEVFFDTFVICSLTGLVIIISGQWMSGLDGATLTLAAFETGMGTFGRIVLAVGVFFFGLTTSSGVYTQIEVVLRYLIGDSPWKERLLVIYKWFYPIPSLLLVFIASKYGLPGTTVWLISDASTAFPIFANFLAMLWLMPKFIKLLSDYKARYMGIGEVDPEFQVFYEGSNVENMVDIK